MKMIKKRILSSALAICMLMTLFPAFPVINAKAIETEAIETETVETEVAETETIEPFASEPMELSGDGIRVVVDGNMSMTVFRVEEDGSYTQMTQKPEPVAATALSSVIQTAWEGKLPWSVGTGTGNDNFNDSSAKLLSDKSGYVTTGTRSAGGTVVGDEVAHDFVVTDYKSETNVATYFGHGDRLTVTGKNAELNLTRILVIETSERNPGVVSVTSKYRYDGEETLTIARFVENNYKIYDPLPAEDYVDNKREAGLWTQQGATLVWGMDYVMPVYSTMGLRNATAMDAQRCANNDLVSRNNWFWGEQGGLPFNDFWGEKVGILVGSAMPHMVRSMELPTRGSAVAGDNNTAYTWVGWPGETLASGVLTNVGTSIVGVHSGDNYQGSRQFEQAMSYIPNLTINGTEVSEDWFASPDPENYPEDAWGNTWESWGGGESFDPIEAINFVNDGTFTKFGIKYVILDACWYPRGMSGGVDLATAQKNGEGGYIAIPSKWASVAAYFDMPNETEADTKAVVRAWNDFMNAHGFKTAAWCMPMSVYLHPGSDSGWRAAEAGSGAEISGRNIAIDTPFTLAHPDYLITANAVEYDPVTGQLLPDQERPLYRRQTGYYPQNGTAELCLGNPRVLEEYTDYFCNLMFKEYGFDGLKIDTQWGTQQCMALGHGHDGNPNASIENYPLYWKTIYDKAKAILGEDPWMKHCQCGTMMNFFTQNGTNRPITGDPGSNNVRKARYSIRMWKGLYGDNAPAVSDHVENFLEVKNGPRRAKSLMAAGYVLESKFWPTGNNAATLTDAQSLKYFPLAAEEGLSKGYYMDEYKFGFDYPEALAYDRPDKATKYYSFFATSAPVSAFTGGEAYTGGGEATMTYSGPIELRGLEPGNMYFVTDYADNTVSKLLKADSKGIITVNVNFTECILLKAELQTIPSETVELTGDGIRVVVDGNMSMTVFRVEEDGSYTQMTQKPEPVAATALSAGIQTAWNDELPWSVGTGTGTSDFNNGSAKLLSDQSGYVTTGTRSTGDVTGNEVAHDFVVTDTKSEKNVATYFGTGDRLTVTGKNRELNLTRILIIETSERNPGVVSVTSKYRNDSETGLEIARFVENNFKIYDPLPESRYLAEKREAGLWTQQGATLVWGMDYVMPVYSTMGLGKTTEMDATRCLDPDDEEQGCDLTSRNNWFWGEQGGLPFNDFWGEKVGILVGSAMPHMIRSMELPTRGSAIAGDNNTAYTWIGWPGQTLEPGTITDVGTSIVGVHTGDNYQGSRQFEQAMSYIPSLAINGEELPADWLASPNPENYPEDAWGNTWESWGGGENFDPIEAINFVNDGTFTKFGIKYVILDACWYPRGMSGGIDLETAQSHGEGSYIAIPSKWASVAAYFDMPNLTDEDTKAVVAKWNDFMHAYGFKTAAWCMPMSVYLHPGNDSGWRTAEAGSGATIDGRKISIDTPFTLAHPDYLITANAVEYDPITGQLLPNQERPQYVRQTGFYPQNGTAELCLGNPRVMEEYTDYFCNLMFSEYGFDGLKIDTQWGTQQCFALGHGHDGNPNAGFENYAMFWKTIYDKAKAILGEDPWMKHCQCGTMMNFFTQNGTNRPITGDPGNNNVRKARYSIRMWKGLYGDNAPAVSDHVENFGRRAKSLMAAGYVLETKFWPAGPNPDKPNKNAATLTDEQCLKYFPLAAEEGLSKGYYIDEYKFGFDYPEALAYDRPDKATKYYSFFATSAPVSAFTGGEAYTGGGETTMTYSGPIELRGLEPGKTYLVTDYADNTVNEVLKADSKGIITTNVNFTECILLKAEVQQDSPNPPSGGGSNDIITTTTQNPDGSITVTVTNKITGTVTKTTTAKDGTKAVTEIKKDGTKTVEVTLPAAPSGAIKLPVDPVKAGESITVKTTKPASVIIPMEDPKPGVVAVLVRADGTEEIIKKSVTGENSIALGLEDSTTVKLVDNGKSFADVAADNWAYGAVQFAASRELFQGTGQGQFAPSGNMTRGMLVTVLARLDGEDTLSGETWYSVGMEWAKDRGVSDGTAPESNITREQLAVMLYRYAGSPSAGERSKMFSDEGNVSGWAVEALTWAVNTGILSGKPGNVLDPTGTATRAEVATILQRFVRQLVG